MEELTTFQILTNRLLYLIGWLIYKIRYLFVADDSTLVGFKSPLLWLTFGLFFAFASLHIFKRILRKG